MPSSTSSSETRLSDASRPQAWLAALLACVLGIVSLGIGAWLVVPLTPVSSERYLAAIEDHVDMLARSKGQKGRIILLGGSGAAFSISAQDLGRSLDRPVYNGGIQASIGIRNLIDLYLPHLDPENDLIVLVPELALLADDARYSVTWCDVIYLLKDVSLLAREPRCAPNILGRTWEEVTYHYTGAREDDPVYRRSGFNAVGDLTSHLDIDRTAPNLSGYTLPEIPPENLDRFTSYIRNTLIARGFEVAYIPAAMPGPACRNPAVDAFVAQLSALTTGDVPDPAIDRFCLPDEMFFDGSEHLNRNGRRIQTESVRAMLAVLDAR